MSVEMQKAYIDLQTTYEGLKLYKDVEQGRWSADLQTTYEGLKLLH
ncbi:Uncharacterized [Moorella glycerini]|nr:Uncharacterized [Moorella glycerini]